MIMMSTNRSPHGLMVQICTKICISDRLLASQDVCYLILDIRMSAQLILGNENDITAMRHT